MYVLPHLLSWLFCNAVQANDTKYLQRWLLSAIYKNWKVCKMCIKAYYHCKEPTKLNVK